MIFARRSVTSYGRGVYSSASLSYRSPDGSNFSDSTLGGYL